MRMIRVSAVCLLLGFLVTALPLRLQADAIAIPLSDAQVQEDPFKFNGVLQVNGLQEGSGVVVHHPKIVLSCAHIVFFDEFDALDPWLGDVRWFWKYHESPQPSWTNGAPLRGYAKFAGYQFPASAIEVSSPAAFEWDVVAHFAYEDLAGGENAEGRPDGLAALLATGPKMFTGYPSGLYAEDHPDWHKMHVTGPFPNPMTVERGAFLNLEGVAAIPGNSGGPMWAQEGSASWRVAGVVVAGSAKIHGGSVNSVGVRAMDADAWALVTEAIGVTPPANDNFAAATELKAPDLTATGSNVGARKEAGEPDHAEDPGGKSVWWYWNATSSEPVTFDTVGTSFDSVLAVYTGDTVSKLTPIGSDDEEGGDGAARVTFSAVAGTKYYLAVDGFGASSGPIVLNRVPAPLNDNFTNRIALTELPKTVAGSNVSATKEPSEPNHAGRRGGNSLWWTWTAVSNGPVTVDTLGSSFDTLLAVYTGDSVSRLTVVASNNDFSGTDSRLAFNASAGTAYQIAVDGFAGDEGRFTLHIQRGFAIARQPESQAVAMGGNAIFAVTSLGVTTPTHQWRKDGIDLIGATNSTLIITNVQTLQGGSYSVAVRDGLETAVSSNAVLTVVFPYTFTTWAGTARLGSADGTGSAARFVTPTGIAADNAGNLYIADTGNNTIRKITPAGAVTTLAGRAGSRGTANGPGSSARFDLPTGVAVDQAGVVYVADTFNHAIRKITPDGVVSTLAGSPIDFPGSADGKGSAARFNAPNRLALDNAGNLYVADTVNFTIRKVTPDGVVSTFAGKAGFQGSIDGSAGAARFSYPRGVAVDASGNVYVADSGNSVIRKIAPSGTVTTLAGTAGQTGSADGTRRRASFIDPVGIAVDAGGNLLVADDQGQTIRKVTADGVVTTLAGSPGISGSTDGPGAEARFTLPTGVAADTSGNIYITDVGNNSVRKIDAAGFTSTLSGKPSLGSTDGLGVAASFAGLEGLAVDAAGNVYVADNGNHVIRKITADGVVSTLAGRAGMPGTADGAGAEARFNHPESLGVDGVGNVFVPDFFNHTIRKITPSGMVTTFAGQAGSHGSADGPGNAARFFHPAGVAVDSLGNIFVADQYNYTIRKITPTGAVSTFAGAAGILGSADGPGNVARFNGPESVAVDTSGFVYVADAGNCTIRKITPDGWVSTLAGVAGFFGSADGPGGEALFGSPIGLTVDRAGLVYVADAANNTIRLITPDGVVTTLAGSARVLPGSADGIGSAARFSAPSGVAVDSAGVLYVSDSGNNTIRKGLPFAITLQPHDRNAAANESVTFNVTALGSFPLFYQWRLGENSLPGQTNAALTVDSARRTSGLYSVAVTGPGGTVGSSNALLRVLIPQRFLSPQILPDGKLRLLFRDPDGGWPDDLTKLEVQWRMDLPNEADTAWQTLNSSFSLSNGTVVIDDPGATGQSRRFYRVVEH